MLLEIWIGDWDWGLRLGDCNWGLDLELDIGIEDLGLRSGIKIMIFDFGDWAFGIRTEDWGLESGLE